MLRDIHVSAFVTSTECTSVHCGSPSSSEFRTFRNRLVMESRDAPECLPVLTDLLRVHVESHPEIGQKSCTAVLQSRSLLTSPRCARHPQLVTSTEAKSAVEIVPEMYTFISSLWSVVFPRHPTFGPMDTNARTIPAHRSFPS